jgi:hypothetical protein
MHTRKLKSKEEIELLKEGGKRLASMLLELASIAKVGVSSLDLDNLAFSIIEKNGDKPSFLNYKPRGARTAYPASIWNDVFMQYNKTAEGKFEGLFSRADKKALEQKVEEAKEAIAAEAEAKAEAKAEEKAEEQAAEQKTEKAETKKEAKSEEKKEDMKAEKEIAYGR